MTQLELRLTLINENKKSTHNFATAVAFVRAFYNRDPHLLIGGSEKGHMFDYKGKYENVRFRDFLTQNRPELLPKKALSRLVQLTSRY